MCSTEEFAPVPFIQIEIHDVRGLIQAPAMKRSILMFAVALK